MIKYFVTVFVMLIVGFYVTAELTHVSYIRGYNYGFDQGVDVVRKDIDLIISRPGVKKKGLWFQNKKEK